MSAKDYDIVAGYASCYFAKKTKSATKISSDKRPITTDEIIGLADWLMESMSRNGCDIELAYESQRRVGYEIVLSFRKIKNEEDEE